MPSAVTPSGSGHLSGPSGFAAILLENGWVSGWDVMAAERFATGRRVELVDAVVALRLVDEADSYAALSIAAGLEVVDLQQEPPSQLALQLVPESVARRYEAVPLGVDNHVLTFATCRPFDPDVERAVALASGRRTRMLVARRSGIIAALNRYYAHHDAAAASGPATGAPVTMRRILVADDEPVTRVLVRYLLERRVCSVLEACNGLEAVAVAHRERPDLLIIDLNMPEMDGFDAIERVRRDVPRAAMPIIVLTAEQGPEVERRVLHLGADDYIVKPFEPEMLLSRVDAAFRRLEAAAA